MPWHLNSSDQIVCTGGCTYGLVPCPVDHATAPDNEEWQDEVFFRCPECDWVRPDEFGENKGFGAGLVNCTECGNGERMDTYNGPCDYCRSRKRPAADRTFPTELHEVAKAHFGGRVTLWTCERCMTGYTRDLRKAHQELLDRQEQDAREQAERDAWRAAHPAGTCDLCGKIGYLQVADGVTYICVNCPVPSPADDNPQAADDNPDTAGDGNPPMGWYADPEFDGHMRYWSGTEWSGLPVKPELID